jgi:hypothetical protein
MIESTNSTNTTNSTRFKAVKGPGTIHDGVNQLNQHNQLKSNSHPLAVKDVVPEPYMMGSTNQHNQHNQLNHYLPAVKDERPGTIHDGVNQPNQHNQLNQPHPLASCERGGSEPSMMELKSNSNFNTTNSTNLPVG